MASRTSSATDSTFILVKTSCLRLSMVLMLMTMVFTIYYTRKAGFSEELLV